MQFKNLLQKHPWEEIRWKINKTTDYDVQQVLNKKTRLSLDDFSSLLSPAAGPFLNEISTRSRQMTLRRFGNIIQMYIPLYLSNECQNICTYCGFSQTNKISRVTLSDEQILSEVKIIKKMGFDNVLLVTGEANHTVGFEFILHAVKLIRPFFANISIEVQPFDTEIYRHFITAGVSTVLVYQETYNEKIYAQFHPKGKKSNFDYRLETPERLGEAGIFRMGLGFLMGLDDWRTEAWFLALHLEFLKKYYWKTKYSVSFPRLRPAEGVDIKSEMTEEELLQLICAFRLWDENLELTLSTRESPAFRDKAISLGITNLSAGSKTQPGGYTNGNNNLEQFEITDNRAPSEMVKVIMAKGYEPVWKDWFEEFRV